VYLQDVPEPVLSGKTNNDLLVWAIELRQALSMSNLDKLALRSWAESQPGTSPAKAP
jgi:hypothetical protein